MGRRRRDEEESEEELDDDDEELLEVGGSGSDDGDDDEGVEDDDGEENDGGGSAGEVDDDDELEAEMAALEAIKRERAAKSAAGKGLKTFVNNAAGLEASLEDFQWTHKAHWIDHMTITGSNTDRVVDVNDDLTRETFFYERALESANECVRKLKDLDVPVRRPDDYYAEMVKSDEHMKRVRSELLHEQQQLEIREERRKAREAKKFGKQVQAEKVKQRTLDKKAQIKSLDKWRKMRQKSGFADDGKAPFDGADDGRRGSKRAARDAKFGFGGRKKVAKRNDKFSANDMSGYKPSSFDKDFRSGKGGNYAPRSGTKGGRGGRGRR